MSIIELLYKHSALFFEQNRPCFRAFQNSTIEEILGIIGQGLTWLSMVIHGYTWLSMVIDGYQWLYMVINGYRWLSMVISGYGWL